MKNIFFALIVSMVVVGFAKSAHADTCTSSQVGGTVASSQASLIEPGGTGPRVRVSSSHTGAISN